MIKDLNSKTVNVKITRHELIDLMLACTVLSNGENRTKWVDLHDKLEIVLKDFDSKQIEE